MSQYQQQQHHVQYQEGNLSASSPTAAATSPPPFINQIHYDIRQQSPLGASAFVNYQQQQQQQQQHYYGGDNNNGRGGGGENGNGNGSPMLQLQQQRMNNQGHESNWNYYGTNGVVPSSSSPASHQLHQQPPSIQQAHQHLTPNSPSTATNLASGNATLEGFLMDFGMEDEMLRQMEEREQQQQHLHQNGGMGAVSPSGASPGPIPTGGMSQPFVQQQQQQHQLSPSSSPMSQQQQHQYTTTQASPIHPQISTSQPTTNAPAPPLPNMASLTKAAVAMNFFTRNRSGSSSGTVPSVSAFNSSRSSGDARSSSPPVAASPPPANNTSLMMETSSQSHETQPSSASDSSNNAILPSRAPHKNSILSRFRVSSTTSTKQPTTTTPQNQEKTESITPQSPPKSEIAPSSPPKHKVVQDLKSFLQQFLPSGYILQQQSDDNRQSKPLEPVYLVNMSPNFVILSATLYNQSNNMRTLLKFYFPQNSHYRRYLEHLISKFHDERLCHEWWRERTFHSDTFNQEPSIHGFNPLRQECDFLRKHLHATDAGKLISEYQIWPHEYAQQHVDAIHPQPEDSTDQQFDISHLRYGPFQNRLVSLSQYRHNYLNSLQFSLKRFLKWSIRILEACHTMYTNAKIIHCNLNLDNIILDFDQSKVLLGNFICSVSADKDGSSKLDARSSESALSGMVHYKNQFTKQHWTLVQSEIHPFFSSPEVHEESSSDYVSVRSDIYSVGAIFFCLLRDLLSEPAPREEKELASTSILNIQQLKDDLQYFRKTKTFPRPKPDVIQPPSSVLVLISDMLSETMQDRPANFEIALKRLQVMLDVQRQVSRTLKQFRRTSHSGGSPLSINGDEDDVTEKGHLGNEDLHISSPSVFKDSLVSALTNFQMEHSKLTSTQNEDRVHEYKREREQFLQQIQEKDRLIRELKEEYAFVGKKMEQDLEALSKENASLKVKAALKSFTKKRSHAPLGMQAFGLESMQELAREDEPNLQSTAATSARDASIDEQGVESHIRELEEELRTTKAHLKSASLKLSIFENKGDDLQSTAAVKELSEYQARIESLEEQMEDYHMMKTVLAKQEEQLRSLEDESQDYSRLLLEQRDTVDTLQAKVNAGRHMKLALCKAEANATLLQSKLDETSTLSSQVKRLESAKKMLSSQLKIQIGKVEDAQKQLNHHRVQTHELLEQKNKISSEYRLLNERYEIASNKLQELHKFRESAEEMQIAHEKDVKRIKQLEFNLKEEQRLHQLLKDLYSRDTTELKNKVQSLQARFQKQKEEYSREKATVRNEMTEKLHLAEECFQKSLSAVEALEGKLRQVQKAELSSVQRLSSSHTELVGEHKSIREKFAQEQVKCATLLEQTNLEKEAMRKKELQWEEERKEMKTQIENAQTECKTLEDRAKEEHQKYQQEHELLTKVKQSFQDAQQQMRDLESNEQELRQQILVLTRENVLLSQNNENLDSKRTVLEEQARLLCETDEKFKHTISDLRRQSDVLREENNELQDRLSDVEALLAEERKQAKALRSKKQLLETRFEELQASHKELEYSSNQKIAAARLKGDQSQSKKKELMKRINEKQDTIDSQMTTIEELRTQLSDMEKHKSRLQEDYSVSMSEIRSMKVEMEVLRKQLHEVSTTTPQQMETSEALQIRDKELADDSSQVAATSDPTQVYSTTTFKALALRIQQLTQELDDSQRKYSQATTEAVQLLQEKQKHIEMWRSDAHHHRPSSPILSPIDTTMKQRSKTPGHSPVSPMQSVQSASRSRSSSIGSLPGSKSKKPLLSHIFRRFSMSKSTSPKANKVSPQVAQS